MCIRDSITNGAAGDNTGTIRSFLKKNGCRTELAKEVMGNTVVFVQCNFNKVLSSVFFSFTDSFRNFSCFSKAYTYICLLYTSRCV